MPKNSQNHALHQATDHIQKTVLDEITWRHNALTGGLSQLHALLKSKADDWHRYAQVLNERARYVTLFQTAEAESVIESLRQPKKAGDKQKSSANGEDDPGR